MSPINVYQSRRHSNLRLHVPSSDLPGVDSIPGKTRTYVENFDTLISEGGFVTMQTGSDTGLFDPSSAGGAAYASSGKGKTYLSIPPGEPNTRYDSTMTTSVQADPDGQTFLRVRCQKLADGTVHSGAFKPIFGNGVDFAGPTTIIHKWRSSGPSGFSYVYDWIGSSGTGGDWSLGGGEYGFPENGVAGPGFSYYRGKATSSDAYIRQDLALGVATSGWNIARVDWDPGVSVKSYINGVLKFTDTATPWTTPKRWLLQAGGSGVSAAGTSGNIDTAWIAVFVESTAGSVPATVTENV